MGRLQPCDWHGGELHVHGLTTPVPTQVRGTECADQTYREALNQLGGRQEQLLANYKFKTIC